MWLHCSWFSSLSPLTGVLSLLQEVCKERESIYTAYYFVQAGICLAWPLAVQTIICIIFDTTVNWVKIVSFNLLVKHCCWTASPYFKEFISPHNPSHPLRSRNCFLLHNRRSPGVDGVPGLLLHPSTVELSASLRRLRFSNTYTYCLCTYNNFIIYYFFPNWFSYFSFY